MFASVPDLETEKSNDILLTFARDKKFLNVPEERESRSNSHVAVHAFPIIGGFGMDVKSPYDVPPCIDKRLKESGMRNDRGGPDKFVVMDEETASVIKVLDKFARLQIHRSFPSTSNFDLGYVQFIRVDARTEIKEHFDTNQFGDIVAVYAIQGKGLVGIRGVEEFLLEEGQFYVFDHRIAHWVDCKQFEETRLTVTLRYFEIESGDETSKLVENISVNGYTTWDIEMSSKEKKIMSDFCSTYSNGHTPLDLLMDRKAISVPLEDLPPCCRQSIFTEKLFQVLSQYFGYEPGIIEALIVKVPPNLPKQKIHPDTTLGCGLSASLGIQFDSFLTTWVLPGTHKPERKMELNCTDHQIDANAIKLSKQPCISESKNAMLFDSSTLHFGAASVENDSRVNSQRMFITFGAILPVSIMKETNPKYFLPKSIAMTNKRVLEIINADMRQSSTRFDYMAFHKGDIKSFNEFALYNVSEGHNYLWGSLIDDVKRVIVKEIFFRHKNNGTFTRDEMDLCAKYVTSVLRDDYANSEQGEFEKCEASMKSFCIKWPDSEISFFIEKIAESHILELHSTDNVVFTGNHTKRDEILEDLSKLYSSFFEFRISTIEPTVVGMVMDFLYKKFSSKQKLKFKSIQIEIESRVKTINTQKTYEFENQDFHISWEEDRIRKFIGNIIFSCASDRERLEQIHLLYSDFQDDTVPDIKRLLYKTFSAEKRRSLSKNTKKEIFQSTVILIAGDSLLYEEVVIPEELLVSWQSKPILKNMFEPVIECPKCLAGNYNVPIPDVFSTTVKDYFELYKSYTSVPFLQEFLFDSFTEKKLSKKTAKKLSKKTKTETEKLSDQEMEDVMKEFVEIRNVRGGTIAPPLDISEEILDIMKPDLLFDFVHSLACEEVSKVKTEDRKSILQNLFSSFKNIPEPSEEVIFIKESTKLSEEIKDLTRQTLAQMEKSDNPSYLMMQLNKLQTAVEKAEKEKKFSNLVQVLKTKAETTQNKEVNLINILLSIKKST